MDNPQDNIITLLGLEDLPLENRAQLVDELTEILEVRVLSAAYDTLSEDQAKHLDTLLNENNPELVTTYIQENVPTLNDIFANQVEALKAELVQHKAEITERLTQEMQLDPITETPQTEIPQSEDTISALDTDENNSPESIQ